GAFREEQADADLPRRAVLAGPVGDGQDAVRRVLAEAPFADDVLQAPRADLHAVLVADLQERTEPGLQFAGRAGEGALGLQATADFTRSSAAASFGGAGGSVVSGAV